MTAPTTAQIPGFRGDVITPTMMDTRPHAAYGTALSIGALG